MAITVPNSSNGNLSSGVFGTTAPVDVMCSSGYTGGGNVTCESTGNYTSVSCTAKVCVAITVPNSSNGNLSSGVFGTTFPVDVTCSSGYTGGGNVTCESTG